MKATISSLELARKDKARNHRDYGGGSAGSVISSRCQQLEQGPGELARSRMSWQEARVGNSSNVHFRSAGNTTQRR
jgi:hypothetical protein